MSDEIKRAIKMDNGKNVDKITDQLMVAESFFDECERVAKKAVIKSVNFRIVPSGFGAKVNKQVINKALIEAMGEVTHNEAFIMGMIASMSYKLAESAIEDMADKMGLSTDEPDDDDDDEKDNITDLFERLSSIIDKLGEK